ARRHGSANSQRELARCGERSATTDSPKLSGRTFAAREKQLARVSGASLQRSDTLLDRRMRHEEPRNSAAAGDAERLHGLRQRGLAVHALQAAQRLNHRLATCKLRTARVRTELALPREPHQDHRGENAEQNLRDEARDEEAGPVAALRAEHDSVDD